MFPFIFIQEIDDSKECCDASFVKMPQWERESGFEPEKIKIREKPAWVTLKGDISLPSNHVSSAEEVLEGKEFNIQTLPLRDPNCFVSGQLHENLDSWQQILDGNEQNGDVLKWLHHGVNVHDFFRRFKGNFKGRAYDSSIPPRQYFPNSYSCVQHVEFICSELCERIATGAIKLLGRVGECKPPKIVMPLTIEPSKPRLCHDERFLNLWVKDTPFHLETLRDIPRIVDKNSLMVTCDEKSGYDHVKLKEESQTYFGIQFGGYFMVYTTIPFGFKASPFIYQSIGMSVTSYLRHLGVLNSLYIDDRFAATKLGDDMIEGIKLSYVLLQMLTRLGYTLSLKKCSLDPSTCKKFLGFFTDSVRQAFLLPEDKKVKFAKLREYMLACKKLDLRTLQRFSGKCISMSLAVPGCRLFCSEVNSAISWAVRNSRSIDISDELRSELEHWRFLDEWSGCCTWRSEFHKSILMSTDSSGYKYGAVVSLGGQELEFGDYWSEGDRRPIHVKEAEAILKALLSLGNDLRNSRVDVKTDNMTVIGAWNGQGSKCRMLSEVLKSIFGFVVDYNVELRMQFVPTQENIADAPSRKLDASDVMLSDVSWSIVEEKFGPHTTDLMSLDSNVMRSSDGKSLRHFTPCATPDSSGVNIFAQDLRKEGNMYVYPPFVLIFPLLCFLEEQGVSCTLIVPQMTPVPMWWPKVEKSSVSSVVIGRKGQKGVVKVPSKKGFIVDEVGLRWPLVAFRVSFSLRNY